MRIDIRPVPHDALANLTATPLVKAIRLAWTLPTNGTSYKAAQVFSSTVNDLETATLVATAGGNDYTHAVNDNATRYYWIRAVDEYGRSTGAYTGPVSAAANRELESAIANIGSDSILSKGEKPRVRTDWETCDKEKASMVPQADVLGVSRTAYVAAHQALSDYLLGLGPGNEWQNANLDTVIDPTVWRTKWNNYADEKQKLINAMTDKVRQLADAAATNASLSKPMDDAVWAGPALATVTDGKVGPAVRRSAAGAYQILHAGLFVPLDRTRTYRTRFWARAAAGTNGYLYHTLQQFTAANESSVGPSNGGRWPYRPERAAAHTDWREYVQLWRPEDYQPGTTHIRPDFLLNYDGNAGYWEVQGFALEDITDIREVTPGAGRGAAINEDPLIEKAEAWSFAAPIKIASSGGMPGVMGAKCLVVNPADGGAWLDSKAYGKKRYAIDPRRVYNLTANLYAANGNNRNMYLFVNFFESETATEKMAWPAGLTGWGGTMHGYPFGGLPPAGQWSRQGGNFGAGTGRAIPSTARYVEIGVWFHYSDGTGSTADQAAQDIRLLDVTEAFNAQVTADAAMAAITNISSDNVLSKGEKPALVKEYEALDVQWTALYQQADAMGINRTAFYDSHIALWQYLSSIPNGWNDFTKDSTIDGPTFRSKFKTRYDEGQKLQNAISEVGARSDVTFVISASAGSGITRAGNRFVKTGAADWNAEVVSKEGFVGGAFASAKVEALGYVMFGLNTDPNANFSYATIDYAMYVWSDGQVEVYINGGPYRPNGEANGVVGSCVVGDVLSVTYDGTKVQWLKNGSVLRSYTVKVTSALYFDSSFNTPGVALSNLRFGPMSSNDWDALGSRPDSDIRNNLIDLTGWRTGSRPAWPVNAEGNAIFPCAPAGTPYLTPSIPGPRGGSDLVWYAQEQSNNGEAGGGWDAPNVLKLDPTRTYRFVVPIRRISGSGSSYWGVQSNTVCDLNTTTQAGNPYFASAGLSAGKWYLFVGFIFPAGSTGNTHEGAGIYDCSTGALVVQGSNWCFNSAWNGQTGHRAYQFYATHLAEQIFGRPMVNLVDGSEPPLREYFEANAMLNSALTSTLNDKLSKTAGNIMTGWAQMQQGGGFVAGNMGWDSSGNRTSGSGVAMTQKGIVGYNAAGQPTITVDATTGDVAVRGEITGSVMKTSVLSLESARIITSENRLAPFTIYDTGTQVSSTIQNMTITLSDFRGPSNGTVNTYHAKRFSQYKKDVFLKVHGHGDTGMETIYIDVAYNGGGWTNIGSMTSNFNYWGGMSYGLRYTTIADWWDTIAFRARTGQGRALSLMFEVQVFNFNESGNAAGSNSGLSSANNGGSTATPPEEPWCVDYETTVLPTGSFVRDGQVGDLLAAWNEDAQAPAIEYLPIRAIGFGEEQSYLLRTAGGAEIIQSKSTPMTLRDGRVATTDLMLGEDVLVNREGSLVWEPVVVLEDVGVRRVVKVNLGDRMYFAGMNAQATIATHNIQYKP